MLSIAGIIGITVDSSWAEPRSESADDREASELAMQFHVRFKYTIYNNTILKSSSF